MVNLIVDYPAMTTDFSLNSSRATAWIVEEEVSYSDALTATLANVCGLTVTRTFGTAEAALAEAAPLTTERAPSLLLMDVCLPGIGGVEATRQFRARLPGTPVLLLSVRDDVRLWNEVRQAGAVGYILKGTSLEVLSTAVKLACERRSIIPPSVGQQLRAHKAPWLPAHGPSRRTESHAISEEAELTEQEREILRLVEQGATTLAAATALHLDLETLRTYMSGILAKLGRSKQNIDDALQRPDGTGKHRTP